MIEQQRIQIEALCALLNERAVDSGEPLPDWPTVAVAWKGAQEGKVRTIAEAPKGGSDE